jgi:hypothetical protein
MGEVIMITLITLHAIIGTVLGLRFRAGIFIPLLGFIAFETACAIALLGIAAGLVAGIVSCVAAQVGYVLGSVLRMRGEGGPDTLAFQRLS